MHPSANSVDTDVIPLNAAVYQCLHFLLRQKRYEEKKYNLISNL